MRKLRFNLTRGLAALVLVLLAASLGCGPQPQPAAPAAPAAPQAGSATGQTTWEQTWERTVAAARQEGKLIIGVPPGPQYEPALRETFGKAYPGIELEVVNLHTTPWSARVAKERAADQYLWDVFAGGPSADMYQLAHEGVFDPLRDDLILPDVLDDSKWLGGLAGRFSDSEQKYVFSFAASNSRNVWINRDIIPESELAVFTDLWKPQFKGKIVWQDPRQEGAGANMAAVALQVYGEPRLRELWAEQQPMFSTDERQMAEWVVRGRYPIGVGLVANRGLELLQQEGVGLNVKGIAGPRPAASPGAHGLTVVNRAPHPNARKVYVNWMLGPDGQRVFAEISANSARLDLPSQWPDDAVPAGSDAINTQGEAFVPYRRGAMQIAQELFK